MILKKSWVFSIAVHMSAHMSTSYFHIQVYVFVAGLIPNVHIMAIPMFTWHALEQLLIHAAKIAQCSSLRMEKYNIVNNDGWGKENDRSCSRYCKLLSTGCSTRILSYFGVDCTSLIYVCKGSI